MFLNRLFLIFFAGLLSVVWLPLLVWFRLRYGSKYMSMIGLKLKEWKHAHLKKKSERGGFQRLSWPRRKFRRACALFKILMKQEVEIQKGKSQQKVEQLRRAIAASPRA